jgi:cell division septation protein DedD
MASGGRRTAGERVLESKHVIGLFLLMLLFSAVFFTLGYVMGRNQSEGQARASFNTVDKSEPAVLPKTNASAKKPVEPPAATSESDPATTSSHSDWEFYGNNKPPKSEPHLEPAPKTPAFPAPAKALNAKAKVQPQPASTPAKNAAPAESVPMTSNGSYVLQVAALLKQDDALAIASSLQKKHYLSYVQTPQKDKYYRVQVGPFKDRKTADVAKKGLEDEGFKAFYVKH